MEIQNTTHKEEKNKRKTKQKNKQYLKKEKRKMIILKLSIGFACFFPHDKEIKEK